MKIFAPLRDSNSVDELVAAGADEFYCGFIDNEWKATFGNAIEMNRRSACGNTANFVDAEELMKAIDRVHFYGKKIVLALNHHQFTKSQLPYVYKMIDFFDSINGDGVILADINAMEYAISKKINVAVSTDVHVYNVRAAQFFADLGVKRIILSRDIPIDTIIDIKNAVGDVEVETFMINGPCKFSDSLCLGLHSTQYGAFCRFLNECTYSIDKTSISSPIEITYNDFLNNYMNSACGLCGLWKLINSNIDACKVVGRVLPVDRIAKEICIIKENIQIAEKCKTEEEYLSQMIRPKDKKCISANDCFYPNTKYLLREE